MITGTIDESSPCFGCFMKQDPVVTCTIESTNLKDECPCGVCLVKTTCKLNLCCLFKEFVSKHFPSEDEIDKKKILKYYLSLQIYIDSNFMK